MAHTMLTATQRECGLTWANGVWRKLAQSYYYCSDCTEQVWCPDRVEHVDQIDICSRPVSAKQLRVVECSTAHAVNLTRRWHSRLPKTQSAPWQFAFKAVCHGQTYAVALWLNPSARTLPGHWLELRRMACAPDAPRFTATKMLGSMTRYLLRNCPEREKCISYQDITVHTGTIYRAANWTPEYFSRPRIRDRRKPRVGTTRSYRADINTGETAAAGKIRWAYTFGQKVDHKLVQERLIEYQRIAERVQITH